MRCVGCEMDPQAPARYCECCGTEISPQQSHHGPSDRAGHAPVEKKEPASTHDDWAPKGNSWDLRCPSCGGPSLDRGRCPACQRAADSLGVANVPAVKAAQAKTPAPPAPATSQPPSYIETVYTAPAPKAAPARPDTARMAAADKPAAPNPKVVWAAKPEAATAEKKPARAAVPARPAAAVAPQRPLPWVVLSAAVVVLCAISVGAWVFLQEESVIAGEGERVPAAELALNGGTPTDSAIPADAVPAAAVPTLDPEPVISAPAPIVQEPKPATASGAKPASPAARSPRPSVMTPAARNVAANGSPAAPAGAVGPFFETKDVNETPKVATRVEPRLSAGLRTRKINEVVIVRALVSQSGHPSQVSLLRRSKTGPELDDVVLAAVNQWTFSPARKKGEPVSCWFNFGVSVGRPE